MRYEFHPEALEEYQAATDWYAERGTMLALRFVEAVENAIWKAAEAPERWRIIEEDVHRCLTRVFSVWRPLHNRTGVRTYCCGNALQ